MQKPNSNKITRRKFITGTVASGAWLMLSGYATRKILSAPATLAIENTVWLAPRPTC